MVAIVGGNELGLGTTSGAVLGGQGQRGEAAQGRDGEQVSVNAVTGNLIIQRQDEFLKGNGLDANIIRTYNSRGLYSDANAGDDNGDNWRLGFSRKVYGLTGTLNTAGSTVNRIDEDGAIVTYTYDTTRQLYVTSKGAGAYDTLSYSGTSTSGTWTWTDGTSQQVEAYIYDGTKGLLSQVTDHDGNTLTLQYNGSLITQITDASGEKVVITYDTASGKTNNITSLSTSSASNNLLTKRVQYGYDNSNRLQTVTVDLSPEDGGITDSKTYVTTYTYDGTSKRVAGIQQQDGSLLSFTYVQLNTGGYRIQSVTDARGTTWFSYDPGSKQTAVTDTAGRTTTWSYDSNGQILSIQQLATNGADELMRYTYDALGNVTSVTDSRGNTTTYDYDGNGNRTREKDALGNTIVRQFGSHNELLSETHYSVSNPGSTNEQSAQTTYYVYDANLNVKFTVSPEGRVTQYTYDIYGNQTTAITYVDAFRSTATPPTVQSQTGVSNLGATINTFTVASNAPALSDLTSWVGSQNQSRTQRTDTTYDFRGQVNTVTTYATVDSSGNGVADVAQSTTQYVYDQAGNLLQKIDARGVATTTATDDYITTYTYDGLGRLKTVIDALGQLTTYTYDDTNRTTAVQLANGLITTTTYDQSGLVSSVAQSNVTAPTTPLGMTTYTYDKLGNCVKEVDPTGATKYHVYDAAGRHVADVDPTGAVVEYTYDDGWFTSSAMTSQETLTYSSSNVSTLNLSLTLPVLTGSTGNFTAVATGYNLVGNPVVSTSATFASSAGGTTQTLSLNMTVTGTSASKVVVQLFQDGELKAQVIHYDIASLESAGLNHRDTPQTGAVVTASALFQQGEHVVKTTRYATPITVAATDPTLLTLGGTNNVRPTADSLNDRTSYTFYDQVGRKVGDLDATGALVEYTYDNTPVTTSATVAQETLTYSSSGQISVSVQMPAVLGAGSLTAVATGYLSGVKVAFVSQDFTGSSVTLPALAGITNGSGINGVVVSVYKTLPSGEQVLVSTTTKSPLPAMGSTATQAMDLVFPSGSRYVETVHYAGLVSSVVMAALTPGNLTAGIPVGLRPTAPTSGPANRFTGQVLGADGLVIADVDSDGFWTQYKYNAAGQRVEMIRFGTPDQNNLSVLSAVTQHTYYLYNARGQLTGVVDPLKYLTEYQYDVVGNKTAEIRYATPLANYTYSPVDASAVRPTASPLDREITYTYDELNQLLQQRDVFRDSTMAYYNRDVFGNAGVIAKNDGVAGAENQALVRQYDVQGRLVRELSAEGRYALLQVPSNAPEEWNVIWTQYGINYSYDANGRITSRTEAQDSNGQRATTYYYYDADGRLTETINALGEVVSTAYNAFGEVSKTDRYNTRLSSTNNLVGGQRTAIASAVAALNSALTREDQYSYTKRGEVSAEVTGAGSVNVDGSSNQGQESFIYDAFGDLVQHGVLTAGSTTVYDLYAYNNRGLQTSVVRDSGADTSNLTTSTTYDGFGRAVSVTDPRGVTWSTTYDKLDRRTSFKLGSASLQSFTYDAFGNVLTQADALGQVTRYAYARVVDASTGNITTKVTVTTPEGIVTSTEANRLGQTVKVTDGAGTTTYAYDANGRLQTTTPPAGTSSSPTAATTNAYDKAGHLITTTDANGIVTQYTYDVVGRVSTRVVDPNGLALVTRTLYDAKGEAIWSQDANGVWTQATYDAKGQVSSVIVDPDQIPFLFDGVYSADTLVANLGSNEDGPLNLTTLYQYDNRGNTLTVTKGPDLVQGQTVQYDYDSTGRKIAEHTDPLGLDLVTSYIYDANGNIVAKTDALGNVSRFIYDNKNELIYSVDATGAVVKTDYDVDGRVIQTTAYADFIDLLNPTELSITATADDIAACLSTANVNYATNSANEINRTIYDRDGRVHYTIDAGNYVTQLSYDAAGDVITRTRYSAALQRNLPVNTNPIIVPVGGTPPTSGAYIQATAKDQTERTVYDAAKRVLFTIDAAGFATQFFYDQTGHIVKTVQYANAVVGTLTSNVAPQIVSTLTSSGAYVITDANADHTTRHIYDAAGRERYTIDPEGHVIQRDYDQSGHVVQVVHYATTFVVADGATVASIEALLPAALTDSDAVGQTNYDSAGRVLNTIDALGVVTQYIYDAENRQTDIIYAYGTDAESTTHFEYDDAGRLIAQTQAYGTDIASTTRYVLDALGNRIQIIDPRGIELAESDSDWAMSMRAQLGYAIYAYDPNYGYWRYHVLAAAELDDSQRNALYARYTTHQGFDCNGRVTVTQDAYLNTTNYWYDAFGNAVQISDAKGNLTYTYFDDRNQAVMRVDGDGYVTQTNYDAFGNAIKVTRFANAVINTVDEFDNALLTPSNPPVIVDVVPTDPTIAYVLRDGVRDQVTTAQYDQRNLKTHVTDALGYSETYIYDTFGNLLSYTDKSGGITTYVYDVIGHLLAQTSPMGVVTAYQYDARGNRTAIIEAQGTALQRTTSYQYDLMDRLTDITYPDGTITHYVIDARGNVSEKYEAFGTENERATFYVYDALNHLVENSDALGVITTYKYDAVGNRIEKTSAVGLDGERTERCEYDANNRLTKEINGEENSTYYYYDADGNLTEKMVGDSYGRTTFYEYDGDDQLISQYNQMAYYSSGHTEYHYDAFGNKIEMVEAVGIEGQERHTLYAYDLDNRLIQTTDALGGQTFYQYDALGNQTQITDANGGVQHNTFDTIGRLVSTLSVGGILTTNTYDIRNNILSTTQSFANGADARTTHYTYDILDRKTSVTDAEGFTTSIQYDVFGNQTEIAIGQYLVAANDAGYDAGQALRAHVQTNTFVYDAANRMLSTTDGEGNVTAFTYDAVGNRTSKTEAQNTEPRTTIYRYDLANRLVEIDAPEGGVTRYFYNQVGDKSQQSVLTSVGFVSTDFEYDAVGRMISSRASNPNYYYSYGDGECGGYASTGITTRYDYDAVGNLLETEYAVYGSGFHTKSSEYDLNNRKIADIDGENNRTTYTYDNLGNRIAVTDALGNTAHYYYDKSNRLIGLLTPEGTYTSYSYDSAGNQVAEHQYANFYSGEVDDLTPPGFITSSSDRITTTQYDGANRAISIVEADGSTTQKTYDGAGNVIKEILYANTSTPRQRLYEYDLNNRLVHFTDVDGTETYFTWDGANNKTSERIVSATDENAVRETQYFYDFNNRLIGQVFDPDGLAITENKGYDQAGNVAWQSDGNGNTTYYYYDFDNRLVQKTDAMGYVTNYDYNDAGYLTGMESLQAEGGTTYQYDRNGRVTEEYKSYVQTYTVADGWGYSRPNTSHRYDALGNEVQTIDPVGNTTTRYFDSSGHKLAELSADNVLTEWQYDVFGNAMTQTMYMTRLSDSDQDPSVRPTPPAGESRTTTTEYDVMGRVVHVTYPSVDVTAVSVTNNSPTTTVTNAAPQERIIYDAFGNAIETIDKAGNHTFSYYDIDGRCVAKVDAMGYLVEWDYDQQGNVIEQRTYAQPLNVSNVNSNQRPTAPAGDVYTVTRHYDAASHLIEEYSPSVAVHDSTGVDSNERILTTYEYDAAGNQISRTIATGTEQENTEYYYYDNDNRKIAVIDAKRVITTFWHDAAGNVTQTKRFANPLSASVDAYSLYGTTVYGFQHLVTSNAGADEETDFTWDLNNNLTREHTIGQGAVGTYADMRYGYDADGRRTWSRNQGAQTFAYGDNTDATQIVYDAMGRVTQTKLPDGSSTVSEYDAAGNLIYQYIGNPLRDAVIGGATMYFGDYKTDDVDWKYSASTRQISFTNMPDLSIWGSGDIRIDFHLDSWAGERSDQNFNGGDYSWSFAEGTKDSGTLNFMEGGIDDREHYPVNDGPSRRTGTVAIYKMVNGVAVAVGDKVAVTFDQTYSYWTAGGRARDYRYSTGSIVAKYSEESQSVLAPATSIVANYDNTNGVSIAWSNSQYAKNSWVVWSTTSHSDTSGYASTVDAQITGNSAVIQSTTLNAGETIYFRVVSADETGNIIYSREESVTIPAVVQDIQISRLGASGVHVAVAPPAGANNLVLYYGNSGNVTTQVAMVLQTDGTYTADVASIANLSQENYRIGWQDAAGNNYSTSAKPFVSTDAHLAATTTLEQNAITTGSTTLYTLAVNTNIATTAAQQFSYVKAVWTNTDDSSAQPVEMFTGADDNHDGTTSYGFLLGSTAQGLPAGHYKISLLGVYPYDNSATEKHILLDEFTVDLGGSSPLGSRQTLNWTIPASASTTPEQLVLIDGVNVQAQRSGSQLLVSVPTLAAGDHDYQVFYGEQVATSHTVDISSAVVSSGYDVAVSVTLDPAEVIAMSGHALTLSWRSLASGEGFADALNLTAGGTVFSGTVPHLVTGDYEAKLSYMDATGSEVIVDIVRFSPQNIVQNFVAPPAAAINIGTRVNVFNERSNGFVGYTNSTFNGDDENPAYGVKGSIANNTLVVNGNTFTIGELQIIDHSDSGGQWKEFVLGFNQKDANFSGSFSIKDANGSVLFSANFSDLQREVITGSYGQPLYVHYVCNSIVGDNYYYAGLTGDFLSTANGTASINFNVTGMVANGVPISQAGNSFIVTASETDGSVATGAVLTSTAGIYAGAQHDNNASVVLTIHDTGNGASAKSIDGRTAGYYIENRYNAANQLIATNAETGLWRTYGVDVSGNRVATYEYGVENNTTVHDSYALFDARNRKVADYGVAVSVYGDTNSERLVTHYGYDALDRQISQTDNAGRSLSREYNALGSVLRETDSLQATTQHWYDRLGHETKTLDALLNTTTKVYNSVGELIREIDGAGNETDYVYDSFGRKTQVKLVGPAKTITSQTIGYDQADRIISTRDALGDTISFGYDQNGNRIKEIDANGHPTNFSYDGMNRLIDTSYDQNGINMGGLFAKHWEDRWYYETHPIVDITVNQRKQYDGYGNLVLEVDGLGQATQHKYGAFARKSEDIDVAGNRTFYEYDTFGNLIHEYGDTGKNIWRSYDTLGRLISVQDIGIGVTTTYAYDLAGNRVREVTTGVVNSTDGSTHNRDITSSYDSDGRVTRWVDSITGMHLNYAWDANGNQKRVYTDVGYTSPVDHWYFYDGDNRLTAETNGLFGPVINGYSYDAFGNHLTWNNGSSIVSYQYDDAGRVTISDWTDNDGSWHTTWQYDSAGNMLHYEIFKNGGLQYYIDNKYTDTGLNFLTQKSTGQAEEDEVYAIWNTYDADGRQIQTVQRAQTDDKHMLLFNHTYYANGLEKNIHGSGRGYYPGDTTFTYDVDGHLIRQDMSRGSGMDRAEFKTFTYNNDGQILSSFHDTGRDFNIEADEFVYANGNEVGKRAATSNASPDVSDVSPVELDADGSVRLDSNGNPIPVDVHAVALQRFNANTAAQQLSNSISHAPGQVSAPGASVTESLDSGSVSPLQNISENYPSNSFSTVIVLAGDTLQSIAARVYGNPSLWFVLADANGLDGSQPLKAGMQLIVPNTVKSGRLDSNAHAVYSQSAIIGSNLPNLKAKPQDDGCGSIFAIIIIVIIAIIAAVAQQYWAEPIIVEGGSGAAAISYTALAIDIAEGAAIYATANVVQQEVLIAMGYQKDFSWSQVGHAALAGSVNGVAAGVTKGLETAKIAGQIGNYAKVADAAIRVTAAAGTQFIQNGQITNWSSLAMAGIQGYFGYDNNVIAHEDSAALDQAVKDNASSDTINKLKQAINNAQSAVNKLNEVGPWLNAAESYARGKDYKAQDWVGAVGQTLGIAYATPDSNNSDAFFQAAQQAGKDLLIGGAMHVLNKNAGDTYLENAVGQDIGGYLGSAFVSSFNNPPKATQQAGQNRANNSAANDANGNTLSETPLKLYEPTLDPILMPTLNVAPEVSQESAAAPGMTIHITSGSDLNLQVDINRMAAMADPQLTQDFQQVDSLNQQVAALNRDARLARLFGPNNSEQQTSEIGLAGKLQNWFNGARASDQADYTSNIQNATNPVSAILNTYGRALNNAGYDIAQAGVGFFNLATSQDARDNLINTVGNGLTAFRDHPVDVLNGLYSSSQNYFATSDMGQIGEDALRFGSGALATAGIGKAVGVTGNAALQTLQNSEFVLRPLGGTLYSGFLVPVLNGYERITTVTSEMTGRFRNMGYLDPITNTFKDASFNDPITIDHILPSKVIANMDGFNTLTKEQMTTLLQDKLEFGNLQPLPQSFNSSKGAQIGWNNYKGKALDPAYINDLNQTQQDLRIQFQNQIYEYQKINNTAR